MARSGAGQRAASGRRDGFSELLAAATRPARGSSAEVPLLGWPGPTSRRLGSSQQRTRDVDIVGAGAHGRIHDGCAVER